jgi:hypothetical protein
MAYTTIDDPTAYFNTNLIPSASEITSVGHQADWIWLKSRNNSYSHEAIDTVRGINKKLKVDTSSAESTDANIITAIGSDSYTVGSSSNAIYNSGNGVGWSWKAGGTASSNSNGSITSSVSANTTAGFSIVSYTGTGSNATIGHGLGSAPGWFVTKSRDTGTEGWMVYHGSLGATAGVRLNETANAATVSTYFNDTAPTSSVFSIGTNDVVNKSGDNYIAYVFAEKKGYSKFSSYVGNGSSDGPCVHTGFRPAWVLVKKTSASDDWGLFDNKRDIDNVTEHLLRANTSDAEEVHANFKMDFLSNGFKFRTTDGKMNGSGASYIYMAFAESPFVNSSGVPANAR